MIKFTVTEEDIRLGQKDSCVHCPIARALSRETDRRIYVYQRFLSMGSEYYPLTIKIQEWIKRFDVGKPVKPTTFTLMGISK